jgi:hypothetical protein
VKSQDRTPRCQNAISGNPFSGSTQFGCNAMHVYAACSAFNRSYHHRSRNNVDDSTMNKGDTSIGGVPPGDLMTDFPPAQSVAPPRKRSCFRKFVAFMSRHRQRTTASPVHVETNYGTLSEFIHSDNTFAV